MLQRVKKFIERNRLLDAKALHLVALSGGADSVALLLILQQLGYRIEAAHCNFKLRGEESDRDELFVKELCQRLGIELHLTHFDTTTYAQLHKVSIEMAARELRYRYFNQLCQDIEAADVCVAHHRDDAVETLLMNLLRGAGIHGLTGIRPMNDQVRRPLLCVSRMEILHFLDSIGQTYVTDSSNLKADVLRNKLRLQVLPLLEEIYPGAATNIGKSAHYLSEAEDIFIPAVKQEWMSAIVDDNPEKTEMSITRLQELPAPMTVLHEWLAPYGFNSSTTEDIFDCINKPGRVFECGKYCVAIDRDSLLLYTPDAPSKELKIPEIGRYRYSDRWVLQTSISNTPVISKESDCATLDAAKVKFPLTVRPATTGDWFVPFGMKGHKLVSDFMTDIKASAYDKSQQLVVTDATGAIIWLVGRRTDQRSCIDADTKETLTLRLIKDELNK